MGRLPADRKIDQWRCDDDWRTFHEGVVKDAEQLTLSLAEAELVAMCRLSAEVIGLMSMARDFNGEVEGKAWADSTAALAIAKRRGAGKLRHINIGMLWIQEVEKMRQLKFDKVAGWPTQ